MRRSHIISFFLLICTSMAHSQESAKDLFQNGKGIPLDRVIPANERGIVCLVADEEGHVYGGTTGRAAHLFVFDAKKNELRDLVRLEGGIGLSHQLILLPDGSLVAGTQKDPTEIAVGTDDKAVGWLYRFIPQTNGLVKTEKLGKPVDGQGIYTLAFDENTKTIFGNTWPDGHFFTYDLQTKKFKDHGAIAGYKPFQTPQHAEELNQGTGKAISFPRVVSKAIFVVPGRGVFTGGQGGYLYKYDFKTKTIAKTDVRLPAIPGRENWSSLDVVCKGTELAGTSEGYLLQFMIAGKEISVANKGRPFGQGTIQGLIKEPHNVQVEEYVGVCRHKHGMPRSFAYWDKYTDVRGGLSGKVLEIYEHNKIIPGGIPKVDKSLSMVGFGAMINGSNKRFYAGEIDRIGRLVHYSWDLDSPKGLRTKRPPNKILGKLLDEDVPRLEGKVVFAPEGTTTDGSGYTALAVGLDGTVYVGSTRYGGYAWLLRLICAIIRYS